MAESAITILIRPLNNSNHVAQEAPEGQGIRRCHHAPPRSASTGRATMPRPGAGICRTRPHMVWRAAGYGLQVSPACLCHTTEKECRYDHVAGHLLITAPPTAKGLQPESSAWHAPSASKRIAPMTSNTTADAKKQGQVLWMRTTSSKMA